MRNLTMPLLPALRANRRNCAGGGGAAFVGARSEVQRKLVSRVGCTWSWAPTTGNRRAGEASYDLVVGPLASYALGPVPAIGEAGFSAAGSEIGGARMGVFALLGFAGAL
jgi:hypothetical protein